MKKLVSIKHVLTDLMDEMELDHTKYKPMFVSWAMKAERKISSWYQYKRKIAVLTIKGCHADLPCDAMILEIALLGDHGCDCFDLFSRIGINSAPSQASSEDSFLIVDLPSSLDGQSNYLSNHIPYHVQDNKLIFPSNLNGQSITVQYRGVELDEDEIPKVMESHVEAITEYIMYKYVRRSAKSGIDIGKYRDHQREWERLAACARADDSEPTEAERQQIAGMLNNPLSGRGFYLQHYNR